jgi:hypothetical protein
MAELPPPPRFRRTTEWYVAQTARDGLQRFDIVAPSERVVELLQRLSAHLAPAVDVVIVDRRDGATWEGAMRFLPDVRESLGRLRWPLATFGLVEISLVTPDEQLSLSPLQHLVLATRESHWPLRLEREGLVPLAQYPPLDWQPGKVPLLPEPSLRAALEAAAQRLELTRVQ